MRIPTATELNALVGSHISTICTCGYHNDADNHCAHFVCHQTQHHFGKTCYGMTNQGNATDGACIRVHEVFARCRRVGVFSAKPSSILCGFIFITQAGNVNLRTHTMSNVPNKHIGIFIGTDVWQYKNAMRQVIKQTPEQFLQHYQGSGYQTFYGKFPL